MIQPVGGTTPCQLAECWAPAKHWIDETQMAVCDGHAVLAHLIWLAIKSGVPSDPVDAGNSWAKANRVPVRLSEGERDELRAYLQRAVSVFKATG